MSSGPNIFQSLKQAYQSGSVLIKLIFINCGIFLLFAILTAIFRGFDVYSMLIAYADGTIQNRLAYYLSAPGDLTEVLYRPWSVISYMFLHEELFHLLSNMLVLFFFGRLMHSFMGNRKVLATYIMGGISGYLLYALVNLLISVAGGHPGGVLLGASASGTAIMIGIATYMPRHQFMLPLIGAVEIRWIAAVLIALDILSLLGGSNFGGHLSHLGGAMWGYFVFRGLKNNTSDFSEPIERWIYGLGSLFKRKPKMRVEYKQTGYEGPKQEQRKRTSRKKDAPKTADSSHQQKLDHILDKISQSGYESLTEQEKEFLFKASNR